MQCKPRVTRWLVKTCLCTGWVFCELPAFAESQFTSGPLANPVIVVAYPIRGSTGYQLQIYEQKPHGRLCWSQEKDRPESVKPLLMEFDFTGSCVRYVDSNGYSIRIGNRDMAREYRPAIQLIGGNLCLMAIPTANSNDIPKLHIGTGRLGSAGNAQKITFDNSWQLSRRIFLGKPVGHVYIENKQSLSLASSTSTNSRICKN
jgi:N-acetylmuramoyl-L-alanine amidase